MERFESVTMLFSDIVEYTSLSTRLEPEQIVVMLNHVYSIYDTICQEEGVFKVETIGDGFMAVGGAPEKCEPLEAAERVARVALRMMQVRRHARTPACCTSRLRPRPRLLPKCARAYCRA